MEMEIGFMFSFDFWLVRNVVFFMVVSLAQWLIWDNIIIQITAFYIVDNINVRILIPFLALVPVEYNF